MKRMFAAVFLFSMLIAGTAHAADQPIFGPMKYDVKERYGKDNVYKESFKATEGMYLIKVQNGDKPSERSDWTEFSVNGEKILLNDKYEHPFIACFVKLQKENTFELVLRDDKPSGFKRPPPIPKFAYISVMPATVKTVQGAFGLASWDGLNEFLRIAQKIALPQGFPLALSSVDFRNTADARADAMRKLTELKDANAQDFLLMAYNDTREKPQVRGEAALGLGLLGDARNVNALMRGVLDSEEKVRLGSARALSFYKEDDTREAVTKTLQSLDSIRRDALIRTIADSGWKPVGAIMGLAEATDPFIANTAVALLGSMGDPRVGDLLMKLLEGPGQKDEKLIITALGQIKEKRAIEPLLLMAADPAQRAGKEVELAAALANLGDQRAADPIADMIKKAQTRVVYNQLRDAYKKLTGNEFK